MKAADTLYAIFKQYFKILTLLIFSLGCVRSAGKWERASQFRTTCVCSSVPVTMLPTARSAAVWNKKIQWDVVLCKILVLPQRYVRQVTDGTLICSSQPTLFEQVVSDTDLRTEELTGQTQTPALFTLL